MYCTRCGSPVTDDDRACPRCGGNLLLPGSVGFNGPTTGGLGPGSGLGDTRIMPPTTGPGDPDSTRVNPRVVPGPAVGHGHAPAAELPDDWFRPGPPTAPPPPPTSWRAVPRSPMVEPAPGQPAVVTQRRYHERTSTSVVVALALVPVVLVALLVWWFLDGGGSGPAARPVVPPTAATTGSSAASQSPPSAAGSGSSAPSSDASSAASSNPTPSTQVPSSATKCSASVYAGQDTSCPFAEAVAAKLPSDTTGVFEVKAKSPVTRKDYTMTCTGGTLIDCRGGDNAEVFIVVG